MILTPVILVIVILYTLQAVIDVEPIIKTVIGCLAVPISCIFLFVFQIKTLPERWNSLQWFIKIRDTLMLIFYVVFPATWLIFLCCFFHELDINKAAHII